MPPEIPNGKVLITSQAEQLIIGTLLGDGCVQVPYRNPRLSITHRTDDLGYLEWKYQILNSAGLMGGHSILFPSYERSASLYTICHSSLWKYRRMFYKNGRKILPKKVLKILTPFSLAIWYMDDGNFTHFNRASARITIYSLAFSKEENKTASAYLKGKFGFLFRVKPYRASYVLEMTRGKDVVAFLNTVRPYIHPTMSRKCPDETIVTERQFSEKARGKLRVLAAERDQAEVMRARVKKLWQDPDYRARWHLARFGSLSEEVVET